jgi:nucleoside-triphosphatase THEP1
MSQFKELQSIKEKLAGHVAVQHKFTDQSKSLCAPGTRVEIQGDILKWLSPQPGTKERIFWITGIAGSGKSTLSATVVERLRENRTPVAAQFFISRNIPETVDPSKIIPTIAKQLAEFSPAAAGIIHDVLKHGFPPGKKQVEELLLAPIRELSKSRDVVVILIDALDELQNAADNVKEILDSIAPRGCYLPDNIRFIVTSRPEHWADISKSKTLELAMFKQRPLMTDSSVSEVHNFIVARIQKMTPMGWDDWPTQDQLLKLSGKANGLFHYAATALQWIGQQIHQYGKASQKRVFDQFTQMGIGQLEDLYRLILTSFENIDGPAQDADWRASQLHGFQHVIGTILVLDEPLAIHQIIALLADIPEHDFDVANFLRQFRSVLIPGTTTSFEKATPQMHKSFRDYLMDGRAPAEFRILTGHAHFVTARSCLEVIVKAGRQSDVVVVKYSVHHWLQHLRKAVEGGVTCEDERMWNLLVEGAVVDVWKANSWQVFIGVATVGWGLLKVRTKIQERAKLIMIFQQGADKDRMEGISSILMKARVRGRPTSTGTSALIGGNSADP